MMYIIFSVLHVAETKMYFICKYLILAGISLLDCLSQKRDFLELNLLK